MPGQQATEQHEGKPFRRSGELDCHTRGHERGVGDGCEQTSDSHDGITGGRRDLRKEQVEARASEQTHHAAGKDRGGEDAADHS